MLELIAGMFGSVTYICDKVAPAASETSALEDVNNVVPCDSGQLETKIVCTNYATYIMIFIPES